MPIIQNNNLFYAEIVRHELATNAALALLGRKIFIEESPTPDFSRRALPIPRDLANLNVPEFPKHLLGRAPSLRVQHLRGN